MGKNIFWTAAFVLKGGRLQARKYYDSPLYNNILTFYQKSPPGILSKRISDFSHNYFVRIMDNLTRNMNRYNW